MIFFDDEKLGHCVWEYLTEEEVRRLGLDPKTHDRVETVDAYTGAKDGQHFYLISVQEAVECIVKACEKNLDGYFYVPVIADVKADKLPWLLTQGLARDLKMLWEFHPFLVGGEDKFPESYNKECCLSGIFSVCYPNSTLPLLERFAREYLEHAVPLCPVDVVWQQKKLLNHFCDALDEYMTSSLVWRLREACDGLYGTLIHRILPANRHGLKTMEESLTEIYRCFKEIGGRIYELEIARNRERRDKRLNGAEAKISPSVLGTRIGRFFITNDGTKIKDTENHRTYEGLGAPTTQNALKFLLKAYQRNPGEWCRQPKSEKTRWKSCFNYGQAVDFKADQIEVRRKNNRPTGEWRIRPDGAIAESSRKIPVKH